MREAFRLLDRMAARQKAAAEAAALKGKSGPKKKEMDVETDKQLYNSGTPVSGLAERCSKVCGRDCRSRGGGLFEPV